MTGDGSAALREAVWPANQAIVRAGLVTLSFGNASGVDRDRGLHAHQAERRGIRGSAAGAPRRGRPRRRASRSPARLRPSSDTPTHLALYRAYPEVGGIVHTHSRAATSWAQACRSIPPFGTTHADHFHGSVPVTRQLSDEEVAGDYEAATGAVIVEALTQTGLDAVEMPAVLVASHGPFTWGPDRGGGRRQRDRARSRRGDGHRDAGPRSRTPRRCRSALLDRHYQRKHGATAYYGQRR